MLNDWGAREPFVVCAIAEESVRSQVSKITSLKDWTVLFRYFAGLAGMPSESLSKRLASARAALAHHKEARRVFLVRNSRSDYGAGRLVATEPKKARTAPADVDIGHGPVSGERVGPRNPRTI